MIVAVAGSIGSGGNGGDGSSNSGSCIYGGYGSDGSSVGNSGPGSDGGSGGGSDNCCAAAAAYVLVIADAQHCTQPREGNITKIVVFQVCFLCVQITRYNQCQISRVYPKFFRLTSTNFDPLPKWNVGCQMVALNYQTSDKFMQINQAMFAQNGR